jgi:hypothetical protein
VSSHWRIPFVLLVTAAAIGAGPVWAALTASVGAIAVMLVDDYGPGSRTDQPAAPPARHRVS